MNLDQVVSAFFPLSFFPVKCQELRPKVFNPIAIWEVVLWRSHACSDLVLPKTKNPIIPEDGGGIFFFKYILRGLFNVPPGFLLHFHRPSAGHRALPTSRSRIVQGLILSVIRVISSTALLFLQQVNPDTSGLGAAGAAGWLACLMYLFKNKLM